MAKQNKKRGTGGSAFLAFWIAVVFLVGLFGLCDIYLRIRSEKIGREIKALEAQRAVLRERLRKEESDWAQMRSPARMEAALRQHGLVMIWPRQEQIKWVKPIRPDDGLTGDMIAGVPGRAPAGGKVALND